MCIGSGTKHCSSSGGFVKCWREAQRPHSSLGIFLPRHPFCHRLTLQKAGGGKETGQARRKQKRLVFFIASKISFTAKRSLKQKYQLAGWHPQPEFSFNHMVAQCQVSAATYGFPPSAFQVLSISALFLPLSLRFWDTSRLLLQVFFFQFPYIPLS